MQTAADMLTTPAAHACVDSIVSVSGDVIDPLALSHDALRQCESVTTEPFDLRCFKTHRFIRSVDRYRGARLTDLIARAGLRCDHSSGW